MTSIAKITSKGQTTVPQEIRALLHVKPGDLIAYRPDRCQESAGPASVGQDRLMICRRFQ